ncbi:hypothetical protein [Paracoccus litorisediminis]|uniref:Uncharacterized protein n=1 Tax=Paracoccus litorisediminis TaxID=2006130 RepID=A0A844HP29_9RHOB|nr:hypothetical protein [Paracoccus litorisediminis]MTH62123.1 hypothetical protein [Paracoccus litorisediminis]
MKRFSPAALGVVVALATAPLAAFAAGQAFADQAVAWLAAAIATSLASAGSAVVAKVTGAYLDAKAREALKLALERGATVALGWLIDQAGSTALGRRVDTALDVVLSYVDRGNPGALARFGMALGGDERAHLRQMASIALAQAAQKADPAALGADLPTLLRKSLVK